MERMVIEPDHTYAVIIKGDLDDARTAAGRFTHHPLSQAHEVRDNVHANLAIERERLHEWWQAYKMYEPGQLLFYFRP